MRFNGVFFDLYGTLLVLDDERAAWEDWFEALLKSLGGMGLALSREEMRNRVDGFFSMPVPPLADDGLTLYERRMGLLTREMGLDLSEEDVSKAASACLDAWHAHVSLGEEAVPLLEALEEDRTLALISNFEHPPHIRRVLETRDLARFFRTVVVSGDTGTKKPDPAIFTPVLESTGLSPERTVYVGDSDVDVEGARAAGIRPILIRRGASVGPIADFRADGEHAEGRLDSTCLEGVTVISALAELPHVLRC